MTVDDDCSRENASLLLLKLCQELSAELIQLLGCNEIDGELLGFDSLNFANIVSKKECHLLSGRKIDSGHHERNASKGKLYKNEWLAMQRREIYRRLDIGLPKEISNAFRIQNQFPESSDIGVEDNDFEYDMQTAVGNSEPINQKLSPITKETWLIRLIRYLIVGLMDKCWVVRHGCAIGLSAIIHGLFDSESSSPKESSPTHADDKSSESSSPKKSSPTDAEAKPSSSTYLLPPVIVNDMISFGLCTLILDRYIDLGDINREHSFPVKEAVAELISFAVHCEGTSADLSARISDMIFEMIAYNGEGESWHVQLGGLQVLRYRCERWQVEPLQLMLPAILVITGTIFNDGDNDDLFLAACRVLLVIEPKATFFDYGGSKFDWAPFRNLLTALGNAITKTNGETKTALFAMMRAIKACDSIFFQSMNNESKLSEENIKQHSFSMVLSSLKVASAALTRIDSLSDQQLALTYDISAELFSITEQILSMVKVKSSITSISDQIVVGLQVYAVQLLCTALVSGGPSVGDLFLVSKAEYKLLSSEEDRSNLPEAEGSLSWETEFIKLHQQDILVERVSDHISCVFMRAFDWQIVYAVAERAHSCCEDRRPMDDVLQMLLFFQLENHTRYKMPKDGTLQSALNETFARLFSSPSLRRSSAGEATTMPMHIWESIADSQIRNFVQLAGDLCIPRRIMKVTTELKGKNTTLYLARRQLEILLESTKELILVLQTDHQDVPQRKSLRSEAARNSAPTNKSKFSIKREGEAVKSSDKKGQLFGEVMARLQVNLLMIVRAMSSIYVSSESEGDKSWLSEYRQLLESHLSTSSIKESEQLAALRTLVTLTVEADIVGLLNLELDSPAFKSYDIAEVLVSIISWEMVRGCLDGLNTLLTSLWYSMCTILYMNMWSPPFVPFSTVGLGLKNRAVIVMWQLSMV